MSNSTQTSVQIVHGNAVVPYKVVATRVFSTAAKAARFGRRVCKKLGPFFYWSTP